LTVGGLAACTLLAGRSVQPVLRALGLWAQFQSISVSRDLVRELFRLNRESAHGRAPAPAIAGGLTLERITFGYGRGERALFTGASLEVAPGEVIGIRGETGSGKTTLLTLILGLIAPSGGRILFDGRDPADWDRESLRRQIAYLPQNARLFQGTVLDNLTLFGAIEDTQSAIRAARLLGLDRIVQGLPGGYQTKVGDGSQDSVSAGTRQLIAMARALAREPKLILFDEANSALDQKSDMILKAALERLKGHATIILVSHRPSLLNLADRVYDIVEGGFRRHDGAQAGAAVAPAAAGDATAAAGDTTGRHEAMAPRAAS